MTRMSSLELQLLAQIRSAGLPEPHREYMFAFPERQWRFDFAWPEYLLAVEAEGGVWIRGRHNRARGFIEDCEKYTAAALMGWMVLRFPTPVIESGQAVRVIEKALQTKGAIP